QPNRRLRLAAEPQTGRREVSALTDARKTLAYDFFRILRAPLLQLEGKQIDFSRLQMPINIEHLRHHWNKFFNRHVNPVIKNALNKKINNYEKRPVSSNIHY
ncbi:hypothetical protein ACP80X_04635, partial [Escherichia coli]